MKYSRVVATPLLANSGQRPLYGEQIEDFLDFLREAKIDYNIAVSCEKDANDATQDLLHSLELCKNTYHKYVRTAKKLAQVRQELERFRVQEKGNVLFFSGGSGVRCLINGLDGKMERNGAGYNARCWIMNG